MFQYSNLWNFGPQYGADWNLTIDIKCVDLTDDSGICSAGLHNCDEQGFCQGSTDYLGQPRLELTIDRYKLDQRSAEPWILS